MRRRIAAALDGHAASVAIVGFGVTVIVTGAEPALWPLVAVPAGLAAFALALVIAMAVDRRRRARSDWRAFEREFWSYVASRPSRSAQRIDEPER